ncbi:hypothetical protein GGR50DRAFT_696240 [Xylaria sp. CBS 124048]|nr:hypothetical protein GGR50DRAFT_696240 [Xylaria sp. CBS 124048]
MCPGVLTDPRLESDASDEEFNHHGRQSDRRQSQRSANYARTPSPGSPSNQSQASTNTELMSRPLSQTYPASVHGGLEESDGASEVSVHSRSSAFASLTLPGRLPPLRVFSECYEYVIDEDPSLSEEKAILARVRFFRRLINEHITPLLQTLRRALSDGYDWNPRYDAAMRSIMEYLHLIMVLSDALDVQPVNVGEDETSVPESSR